MAAVKKFEGELPKELDDSRVYIPSAVIPFDKDDMQLLAIGMQGYMCVEIESDEILQIQQKLREALSTVMFLPRSRTTIESVGYILRSNTDLLWSEFYEINNMFYLFCENNPMPFSYGISEDKAQKVKIRLSVFYFTGDVQQKSLNTHEVKLDDSFIAQVKAVNKIIVDGIEEL